MNRRRFLHHLAAAPAAISLIPTFLSSSPPISGSMWTYVWDIAEEGYDFVLGTIRDHGMDAVSVAAAYHAGKFLSPHNPKRTTRFLEDGTVYFQPTPSRYGTIKPIVNSLVGEGHHLERVKAESDLAGLETRAWVVCCHNTPLGMRYPNAACETVFGDKLFHNLCPSNALVRTYVSALVVDLASKGISVIELEALQFQGYTHGFHHEREGIPLNAAMKFLLGICFCPSCQTRARSADIDFDAVKRFTRATLQKHFTDPYQSSVSGLEDLPDDLFDPFHRWRQDVVASFIRELAEALGNRATVLRPLISMDSSARTGVGANPARAAAATGGILVPGYVKNARDLVEPLTVLKTLTGGWDRITVGMQVGLPESGGKKEFLDRMVTARGLGISRFNFYNYGFIPLGNLQWIKESLQE